METYYTFFKKFWGEKRKYAMIAISVIVSFFFVSAGVYGATTVSTNISTGGTLSVGGLSTLYGGFLTASSTATSTLMVSGTLRASSTLMATGAVNLSSTLAIGATSSPAQELGMVGDALQTSSATTSHIFDSTGTGKGGCIQLKGTDGNWYHIYATSTASYVFFQSGVCQ